MSSAVFCHSGSIQCLPVKNILQKRKTPFKAFSPVLLQKPSWVLLSGRYSSPSNTISSYSHNRRMPFNFKHSSNIHRLSSSLGNDVAIQKSDTDTVDAANENSPKETELKQVAAGSEGESISAGTSSDSKRARPSGGIRRNTNPQIKDDQLVPGAVFTGKVRSVQSYGAFVEFGASIQGLVHISRVSKSYVNDIKEVLSVGQEVTVKIEEANLESGRISLTMLIDEDLDQDEASDNDNENAGQRQKSSRRFGRNKGKEPEFISKFQKGQVLEGKVKGFVPNGAIIELPENEEGFLPTSELSDDFTSLNGEMLLTRSQKVTVQVVRMEKGRVRLTMNVKEKTQANAFSMVEQEVASNPFELAFRKHPIISTFLTKKEENLESSSIAQHVDASMATADLVDNQQTFEGVLKDTQDVTEGSGSSEAKSLPSVPETNDQVGLSNKMDVMDSLSSGNDDLENENASLNLNTKIHEFASSRDTNLASADVDPNVVATSGDTSLASASAEPNVISASELEAKANLNSEVISNTGNISASLVKQLREETGAGMIDCKKALNETSGDTEKAREFLRKKGLASAEKKATRIAAEGRIGSYIHDSRIGVLLEVNCETDFVSRGDIFWELVEDLAMQIAACPNVKYVSAEDVPDDIVKREREIELQKEDLLSKPEQIREKIVDGRIRKIVSELALLEQPYIKNDKLTVEDMIKQRIATVGENIRVRRFVRYNLGEGLEKKSQDFAAEVAAQTASTTPVIPPKNPEDNVNAAGSQAMETLPVKEAPVIPATLVRQLREETGAGMMDCKKALTETAGDLALAQEFLRKKGLASADKKSSRIAAEGRVGSYVHDSRIGVLIEVNCETDFVARGDAFKQLVEDLAMQVVASSQVQYVSVDDIPKEYPEREKEIEMQRVDLQSKPQEIREKIVDGRVTKRLGELALLEQPFIKDDKFLVKDIVKQAIAKLGENIQVRRFTRYNLGEGLEKKVNYLSTEIAEQTKSKT